MELYSITKKLRYKFDNIHFSIFIDYTLTPDQIDVNYMHRFVTDIAMSVDRVGQDVVRSCKL